MFSRESERSPKSAVFMLIIISFPIKKLALIGYYWLDIEYLLEAILKQSPSFSAHTCTHTLAHRAMHGSTHNEV